MLSGQRVPPEAASRFLTHTSYSKYGLQRTQDPCSVWLARGPTGPAFDKGPTENGPLWCVMATQDDELVLQRLEAAIAAGPDPELDALTKCTGCRVCGHEGGRKSKINAHSGAGVGHPWALHRICVQRGHMLMTCKQTASLPWLFLTGPVRGSGAVLHSAGWFPSSSYVCSSLNCVSLCVFCLLCSSQWLCRLWL